MRNGSRFLPVSQDGSQPSEIHDSNGVIPVSAETLECPLPVDIQVQETISFLMTQPTLQMTQRSHSDPNRIPFPSASLDPATGSEENLSTDFDPLFADMRSDGENSEVLFPTLKREAPPPPCYQEVMKHAAGPGDDLSTDSHYRFADLRRDGDNSEVLFSTHNRESPPPPSYQEVIEGGYVQLRPNYQQSTT